MGGFFMLHSHSIPIPKQRGKLRAALGKEYFIARRRLKWLYRYRQWTTHTSDEKLTHNIINHQSVLLRKLKNTDMQLQHNKITNLRLAAACINGVIIKPGQTFSFWKLVGRPTAGKGYKEGLVLKSGKIAQGIGGGLCQMGNLIYWMVLHSSLTITERWRHGYDVFPDVNRVLPFGSGATLSYNYIDLQVTNNTTSTYQLLLWLDEALLHGALHCNQPEESTFEITETDHCIRHQWWGGYTRHNKIWKNKTCKTTSVLTRELVTQNHAVMMYEPLIGETGINNISSI
jgi:vancomycin resistance protein VanW